MVAIGTNGGADEAIRRGVDDAFVTEGGRLQDFATLLTFFLAGKL